MPVDLTLPDELRPADGRFGSGPARVRPEALAGLAATGTGFLGTSHRRPPVRAVVARIRDGLRRLYSLPDDYEVALGNGGATAFWDAAIFCLIDRRSHHLVFGEFSGKFAAAVGDAPHLEQPTVAEAPPGGAPELRASRGVDAYALTHNETSTGVMIPITRPDADGIVLVDGTSAAGAIEVEASAYDAYYCSPQKALGADGGLWLALLSPAAIDRIQQLATDRWCPPSLDLTIALENSRLDQTYNTPALATLHLLADQVEWLLGSGGLRWSADQGRRAAGHVYGWAESTPGVTPFVTDPLLRSTTVATIDLDGVDAEAVASVLRDNGIVDLEGYRKLGRNQLRIAMFPSIPRDDLERLTAAIDWVRERLA